MNELEAKALVKSLSDEELQDLILFLRLLREMPEEESKQLNAAVKNL